MCIQGCEHLYETITTTNKIYGERMYSGAGSTTALRVASQRFVFMIDMKELINTTRPMRAHHTTRFHFSSSSLPT